MHSTHEDEYAAMSWANYIAYTQAWCVSEGAPNLPGLVNVDVALANDTVRAGVVFG